MKDLTGQKFNRLTAIRPVGQNSQRCVIWEFKCDCGKVHNALGSKVRLGTTKSCGCLKMENLDGMIGKGHHGWRGHEDISLTFLSRMKDSAQQRGIHWGVTVEYLWSLFLSQDKRCALSGHIIFMPLHVRSAMNKQKYLASLDRIDNTRGYIEGNVQWVCRAINYMKGTMSQISFVTICNDIVRHQKTGRFVGHHKTPISPKRSDFK